MAYRKRQYKPREEYKTPEEKRRQCEQEMKEYDERIAKAKGSSKAEMIAWKQVMKGINYMYTTDEEYKDKHAIPRWIAWLFIGNLYFIIIGNAVQGRYTFMQFIGMCAFAAAFFKLLAWFGF